MDLENVAKGLAVHSETRDHGGVELPRIGAAVSVQRVSRFSDVAARDGAPRERPDSIGNVPVRS